VNRALPVVSRALWTERRDDRSGARTTGVRRVPDVGTHDHDLPQRPLITLPDFESAARLLGEARKHLDDVGSPEDVFAGQLVASVKGEARDALGDLAYEAAYAEGLASD